MSSTTSPNVNGDPGLTSTQAAAVSSGGVYPGLRTVLFGDSMTSQYYVDTAPASATYVPDSGVLTITDTSHGLATGWSVDVFNRSYAALKIHQRLQLTRVNADTYTVNVGANLSGLPGGALTGTTYCRVPSRVAGNSWVNWMQMLLGQPFQVVYNGAQSGDTSADCLARLQRHCLAYSPQVVVAQLPGINDMSTGNGPVDEETIYLNNVSLIDQIASAGAFGLYGAITPVASGEARGTVQNMARVERLNRRLRTYVNQKRGTAWVDHYSAVVNPTDTTGLATASWLKTTDKIHYSIPGALAAGKRGKTVTAALFPSNFGTLPRSVVGSYGGAKVTASSVTVSGGVATFTSGSAHGLLAGETVGVFNSSTSGVNGWVRILSVPSSTTFTFACTAVDGAAAGTITASRSRNIFDNCVLSTATGGGVTAPVTGTVADGINCRFHSGSGTAVASVIAHPDGYGNMQRLVTSAAVLNDLPGFQSEVTSTLNQFAIAGEKYVFEADYRPSSANWANTPVSELMFRLIVNVDGVLYSAYAVNTYDGLTANSIGEDLVLHVRTAELVIPAGTVSQFYFQVYLRANGNVTANLTQDLGCIAINRIDP